MGSGVPTTRGTCACTSEKKSVRGAAAAAAHPVKQVTAEVSKLTAKSRSHNIQNYTLVRQDRRLGPGGGLLFFIHNSVSFTRKPLSTMSKNDPHLEELTISIAMDNTELLITNVYIPRPVPAMGVIHHHSTTY